MVLIFRDNHLSAPSGLAWLNNAFLEQSSYVISSEDQVILAVSS